MAVSERVHDALRREILEGRLAPGDAVPSERALAERHEVNRHAIREALKRLQQAGLVRISHGGATRVLDWRETAGLEVLLDLMAGGPGPPPHELARSVLEMRASIGVDAARRCAQRGSATEREAIGAHAEATAAAIGGDAGELDRHYAALWRAVVAGSGNVAYRLALNSLLVALAAYEELAARLLPTAPGDVRALGGAIAGGDADAAVASARRLLEPDVAVLDAG